MVQFDFTSVLTRLENSLSAKFNHQELLFFGTNRRLLEVVAEEIARLSNYDEYLTREAKWGVSRNISSLLTQAQFFNYKAHRKIGANGVLRTGILTSNGGWPLAINIPRWSIFSGGGLTFVADQNYTIAPGDPFLDIRVKQGTPKTKIVEITEAEFGDDPEYITILLDNDSVDNALYSVRVNGIMWQEIEHIRDAPEPDSQVFVTNNTSDFSGVVFQFGNDVFGKKLEIGDIVQIRYLETRGEEGNVLSSGIITTVESQLFDTDSQPVTMVCNNLEPIANGRNYESQESIRVNAPRSYQTGDRAMTRDDYVVIIRREGLSDRIIVWGEKEVNEDRGNPPGTFLLPNENLIFLSGFNIDATTGTGIRLTSAEVLTIREVLNELKGPTDILQFIDSEFINIVFHVQAFVTDRRFSREQILSNVFTGLREKYKLADAQFKRPLRYSQYYEFINSIEGVNHHKTELSFNILKRFKSAYEFDIDINLVNIQPNSVKIYVALDTDPDDWFLIATDDGIGNFDGELVNPDNPGEGTYELPGSNINYADGLGLGRVTFGLNQPHTFYTIRVDFELSEVQEGDLILTRRQQIAYFYDAEIDVLQLSENE